MLKALDQVFGSDSSKLDRRPSFDFISSWPTFDKALVAQYQIYNENCFFHFIVVVCFMLLFFPEEPGWSVWRDLARQHLSGTGLLHAHVALIVSVGLSQGHQGYHQKQSVWGGLRYCGNSFDLLFFLAFLLCRSSLVIPGPSVRRLCWRPSSSQNSCPDITWSGGGTHMLVAKHRTKVREVRRIWWCHVSWVFYFVSCVFLGCPPDSEPSPDWLFPSGGPVPSRAAANQ